MRVIAERREKLGKENAKKIRRQGFIPAVIYGNGKVYEHIIVIF
jgi:large subunit ribosomal protein L25